MGAAAKLEDVSLPLGEDFPEIRDSVRRICAKFPGAYWRELEAREAYPTEFVRALTEAGYLAALIPEEYGGAGLPLRAAAAILEEIHATGCNAGACHAQMYIMGTLLRHGNARQKSQYLPQIASGALRLQAFGVTEPTTGTDTTKLKTRAQFVKSGDGDHYLIYGQKVWTSRALHSDLMLLLARTTPVDQVKKKTEGLSVFLLDIRDCRGKGLEIKPAAGDGQSQRHRGVLRRRARAGGKPDRRGGQGLQVHPRRHERRAHPRFAAKRSAMRAGLRRRPWPTPANAWCSTGRSGRTRACSFRLRAPTRKHRRRT